MCQEGTFRQGGRSMVPDESTPRASAKSERYCHLRSADVREHRGLEMVGAPAATRRRRSAPTQRLSARLKGSVRQGDVRGSAQDDALRLRPTHDHRREAAVRGRVPTDAVRPTLHRHPGRSLPAARRRGSRRGARGVPRRASDASHGPSEAADTPGLCAWRLAQTLTCWTSPGSVVTGFRNRGSRRRCPTSDRSPRSPSRRA